MYLPYWFFRSERKEKKKIPYWLESIKIENKEEGNQESSLVTKTREYINSFCTEIADKTLALQFRQFKVPREDIKELTIENIKTYKLSDAEIEKYLDAIKKINEKDVDNINKIKNISKKIKNINIDLGGFSLDIGKELGMDYLRGNYILISTEQRNCDIIRKYASFGYPLIKKLLDSHCQEIKQILLGEAIIGKILGKLLDIQNPENMFDIEMEFDTPTNAITKLKKIREEERRLLNDPDRLKDRKYLKNLLDNIEEIVMIHGSLDRIQDIELTIKAKLDYYKINLDRLDIYCLNYREKTIFIYFDSIDNFNLIDNFDSIDYIDDIKNIYRKDNLTILNGNDSNILNLLIDLKLVGYSPYLGLERAVNMIARTRSERLKRFLEKNPESADKKLFLEELMKEEKMPEKAKELLLAIQSLVRNGRDRKFFYTLGKNKIYTVYPLIQDQILYEILSRVENDDIKSVYMDTSKFIETVSGMNDEQLIEFLNKILDSLEFRDEYNPVINMWLKENKKDICERLGINFVYDNVI